VLHSTHHLACPQASVGRFGPVASVRWPGPLDGSRQTAPEACVNRPMPVASARIRPGSPAGPQAGARQGSPAAGGRIPGPVATV
jgi:hypothetical protein